MCETLNTPIQFIALLTGIATAIGFAMAFLGGGLWIFVGALKSFRKVRDEPTRRD